MPFMPLLLNIDTATEYAGVCLSKNGMLLAKREHDLPKDHASFLQIAIQEILAETNISLNNIDAVAVTGGPGSYTGIRVGLASAKGICFALNKRLIIINTLAVIAQSALEHYLAEQPNNTQSLLLYPMIDARRMEVFAGLYNEKIEPLGDSKALILSETSFTDLPNASTIIFCGSGAKKLSTSSFLPSTSHLTPYTSINTTQHTVNQMIVLAEMAFVKANFADIAYSEPLYVKEFYNSQR